ncbi:MAG: secondary thiamine-phosphate synthase enzyme [Solidesulfovibrio magneticus str. Maddingley MBC34]|uniref:Secondary thiamine-phosphate synthase enzyme n=1 Tax=Solidesulfovibrio magneticus str. Maddingley MBC34 TaxID=1206767 RepID=K6GKK8_9BACT|nr:MAG: secondary thiamine-phosphate synthase enzyme [Solidesulfovibrio magneticus str. Maddingley MBC34]
METLELRTPRREALVRITPALADLIAAKGWQDGAVVVFCPHTTAGLTVNEDADPDVATDMVMAMGRLVPRDAGYRHAEGNSDAHVKTTLVGPSLTLIVSGGRLQLGTWQGVYLCEWDGPRTRKVWVQWLRG